MIESLQIERRRATAVALKVPPMVGLQRVTLVVGPAGSGKTRFLELLEDAWRRHVSVRGERDRLAERLRQEPDNAAVAERLADTNEAVDRVGLRGDGLPPLYRLQPRLEEALDGGRPSTWWRTMSKLDEPDFAAASSAREIVVRHAARVKLDHAHGRAVAPELVAQAERTFALVEKLTGLPADVALSRDPSEPPLLALGRRRAWEARLTDGLRMALSWAVLISLAGHRLKGAIVLIDDPERDLQPEATTALIEALLAEEPAQLWIATGSPALLSGASPAGVLRVHASEVAPAGAQLPEVLDRMHGGFRGVERTQRFAALAEDLAHRDLVAAWLHAPARPWAGQPWTLLDPAPDEGSNAWCLCRHTPGWAGYRAEPFRPWFRGDGSLATPDTLREGGVEVVLLFDVLSRVPLGAWGALFEWLRARVGEGAYVALTGSETIRVARRRYLPQSPQRLAKLLGLGDYTTSLGRLSEVPVWLLPLDELRLPEPEALQVNLLRELETTKAALLSRLRSPSGDALGALVGGLVDDAELALRVAQLEAALLAAHEE